MAKGKPGNTTTSTALGTFDKRITLSRDYTSVYFDRFIENYKHYLGHLIVPSGTNYPLSSQMTVPISYSIVETILPRMMGKDPEFMASARNPEDRDLEKIYKPLVHYWWTNPALYQLGDP